MAIVSLLVTVEPNNLANVAAGLTARSDVFNYEQLPENADRTGFAVGLECLGDKLPAIIREISALPNVVEVHLVYVNYEDDLDEGNLGQTVHPYSNLC